MMSPAYWLKLVVTSDAKDELEVAWDAAASAGLVMDCAMDKCRHIVLPFSCLVEGEPEQVQVNLYQSSERRTKGIYRQLGLLNDDTET